jgi:hypothetical protein
VKPDPINPKAPSKDATLVAVFGDLFFAGEDPAP